MCDENEKKSASWWENKRQIKRIKENLPTESKQAKSIIWLEKRTFFSLYLSFSPFVSFSIFAALRLALLLSLSSFGCTSLHIFCFVLLLVESVSVSFTLFCLLPLWLSSYSLTHSCDGRKVNRTSDRKKKVAKFKRNKSRSKRKKQQYIYKIFNHLSSSLHCTFTLYVSSRR